MEVLLIFVFIFLGSWVFVYIIDTLCGKTAFAKQYKSETLEKSIAEKVKNKKKLNEQEYLYIAEQIRLAKFEDELLKNSMANNIRNPKSKK